MSKLDTLIVGGGLAGLSLAHALNQRVGKDRLAIRVLEARDRLGGRIHSHRVGRQDDAAVFDLGPTWFWQGQPRMTALIEQLDLKSFEQYATGELLYQDERGQVHRGHGHASMQGSLRVVGGLSALIEALANSLGSLVSLEHRVNRIAVKSDCLITELASAGGAVETIVSDCVVLAIPPRVAAQTIEVPSLSAEAIAAMRAIPTWMAGQAKAVAIYERPFWREAGLSGDAMSRVGPLAEIHDASPATGGPHALFGFVGVGAQARHQHRDELVELIRAQLVAIFGDEASEPIDLVVKDWAFDVETATELDHQPTGAHPNGLPRALQSLCGGRLIMGSTEVAATFGGYLEGALEAAESVARLLNARVSNR